MEKTLLFYDKTSPRIRRAKINRRHFNHQRLEKEQRRATKNPTKLIKMSYDQSLAKLVLTSLKDRRLTGDLIQTFKIMKGLEVVKWEKDIKIKERTRGHYLSYYRESFKGR